MKKSPKKVKNYAAQYAALKDYTSLRFRNSKNFSPKQKREITAHLNVLLKQGLIKHSEHENKYIPLVKFIPAKNKKSKKDKLKGAPKINGIFIRGATPRDKIDKKGRIKGEFFDKILIPLDFTAWEATPDELYETEDGEEPETGTLYDFVYQELASALTPYYEELNYSDYFTVVTANGWEMGRGRNKDPKKKKGKEQARDVGKTRKVKILAEKITDLLARAAIKYQIGLSLVSGLYLYKFKKQRKPSKKEKSVYKRKKK